MVYQPTNPTHQRASAGPFTVTVHHPRATEVRLDARGTPIPQGLATGRQIQLYSVDDYKRCPDSWLRSDPRENLASFFFAYELGHMVWFDFNANGQLQHEVAVMMSAQGVNAISGRHSTWPARLEQYKHNCPTHGTPLSSERRCDRCGFNWPAQNYLATTATPSGRFWRDGVRDEDGKTAEFVFTEKESHGVAANVIGDARNFAFSFAFFQSKQEKPPQPTRPVMRGGGGGFLGGGQIFNESVSSNYDEGLESFGAQSLGTKSAGATRGARPTSVKQVEVGMGAVVDQGVETDPKTLDYWRETADGNIRLYYCSQAELADILAGGRTGGDDGTGGGGSRFRGVPRTGGSTF